MYRNNTFANPSTNIAHNNLTTGLANTGNSVEKFKQLVDVLQRYHLAYSQLTVFGKDVDHDILSVEFGANILAIKKKTREHAAHEPFIKHAHSNRQRIKEWEENAQATSRRMY